jgi:peptide-methionine (S)-S-oxide reductase
MFFLADVYNKKIQMPTAATALPGRDVPVRVAERHYVNKRPLKGPYPDGMETIQFGMGCFWGAERLFWKTPGVWVTMVGFSGGMTKNPTYQETCTGMTGHAETVLVVFDPKEVSLETLLKLFWEEHDPTQGMRQGNDVGTTYRSVIYASTAEQLALVHASKVAYQAALDKAGHGAKISTEIDGWKEFYFAEDDHQQYLAKNPGGYCGLRGTGVSCVVGGA